MSHQLTAFYRAIFWLVFIFLSIHGQGFSQTCNNWLYLPSFESYVSVGDLDVPGTKITVEATFVRTTPYTGGQVWAGDLVSKHVHPTDANYLLRPNNAEITTSNGYFRTPDICEIELNKVYHAAMVYDGSTLKFYRNGFLMSSVPATGTMFQNDFETRIGLYDEIVHNTNLIGYINNVRIWNTVRTQAQIRAYMNTPLPTPATQPGLLAYYTFDNLLNKQGNPAWNGVIGGSASINKQVTNCNFVADSCAVKPACALPGYDFDYKQDVCDPNTIRFKSIGNTPLTSFWDFGDGSSATGNLNPSHTYQATGNYVVKYAFGNGVCTDTVRKSISVNILKENLILTPDTTICIGSSPRLRTAPALSFCWSPTTYLDNPNSPNPVSSATEDITYYFTAETTGSNLISNGNFTQGNMGFTSGYNYTATNVTEGQYFVGPNPRAWNSSLSTCTDHTSGNGNMMLVNGSPVADITVWRQTVNVTPNTNYAFSTWIQALWPPNPAQLQFSINGQTTGVMITASLPTCTWTQFYTTWNSGNSTTAVISIVNKNTQVQGNDFALDDISFAEVFIKRDSVKIKVEKPIVTATIDTTLCPGKSVQLNATGALTYSWTPAFGLSATNIANPVAKPSVTTRYFVTGTTQNGCSAKDSTLVGFHSKPLMKISNDTAICKATQVQLSVSGGATYAWSPAASLNNPSISNPIASPNTDTKYYVNVVDIHSCEYRDSVSVAIKPVAVFSVDGPHSMCLLDSIQLNASGGDTYSWQPLAGLSTLNSANPKASPSSTTDYMVTITESECNQSATLTTRVTVNPLPNVNATKASDIDCRNKQAGLSASGAASYVWMPAQTLNNANIANPIATPTVNTRYIVTGTSVFGCQANDSVDVIVVPKPTIVVSSDTMICKNSMTQLSVTGGVSYSWTPAASLSDPFISNPLASPTTDTRYFVSVKDHIDCEYIDSVTVLIKPDPVFSVSDVKVCNEDSVRLNASGGDSYLWSPATGLNNADISNPLALPGSTRDYLVTITESACNQSATLTARVTVLPAPTVTATKSNDIDCSQSNSRLNANGAQNYTWMPAQSLSNANLMNPIATPDLTTEYIVKGIDAEGCIGFDTIVVKVENLNRSDYQVPNAFTPNNDGLNDCFKIKYWGVVNEFEFSVFNRWGQRLFFTKDPAACWDGTAKGVLQDGGVYVYLIKAKTFCQPEVFRKGTFVLVR